MAIRRHVLITGGGRGIGAEIARRFAALGDRITVLSRSRDEVEKIADEVGGIFDTSTSLEQNRFLAKINRAFAIFCSAIGLAEPACVGIWAMVCVNNKTSHSGLNQMIKRKSD